MDLLEDIQSAAVDSNSDVASLLRRCKLLAAKLGSRPLEDWLLWESDGYPDGVQPPDYRMWQVQVRGHFAGPFGSSIRNAHVPILTIPEEFRERCQTYPCRLSIASIEASLRDKASESLTVEMGDLLLVLGMNVYRGYSCLAAWGEFSSVHLVEVVNAVRNRVLDFAIALGKDERAFNAGIADAKELVPERITQLFYTIVYGGEASVVGSGSIVNRSVVIQQGDISGLRRVLLQNGIADVDVNEIQQILGEEPLPRDGSEYGPRVTTWIGKMLTKAAKGTWEIGSAAAGNILSQCIAQYYGLPR